MEKGIFHPASELQIVLICDYLKECADWQFFTLQSISRQSAAKHQKLTESACKSFLDFLLGPLLISGCELGHKPSLFHTIYSHILHIVVRYTAFAKTDLQAKIPNVLYI